MKRRFEVIERGEAGPFLFARALWPIPFTGAILFGWVGIDAGFLLCIAITAPFLAYSIFWKCPNCNKFFALKMGAISIAWPYFNSCSHCGARIKGRSA